MSDLLRITAVESIPQGVLKLAWSDGYEALVDLRGIIADGDLFDEIRPEIFRQVRVDRHGHSIYWGEEGDELVDFGCDRLREIAEKQAAMLAHVG